MSITIIGPEKEFRVLVDDGQGGLKPNVFFYDLIELVSNGITKQVTGDTARITGITDLKQLTIDKVIGIVSLGAQVFGYPAFVELTTAQYDQALPEALHGSTVTDDLGDIFPVAWRNWETQNNPHVATATGFNVPLNYGGTEASGGEILALIQAGYTVKSMAEWPQAEPEE